jgi:HEAT repeat protein
VVVALSDPDTGVQRAALSALAESRGKSAVGAIARLLESEEQWPIRVRAAEALGSLAAGSRDADAVEALTAAALKDDYALVREAAVRALSRVDPAAARPILRRVRERDREPRVRDAAGARLGSAK